MQGDAGMVKLRCTASAGCRGKLTLFVQEKPKREGKQKRLQTTTIGAASFSVAAGAPAVVKIELNASGRALLRVDHGRLEARLSVLQLEPSPARTQTAGVLLVRKAATRSTTKGRRR